jgi:hypothetical protein
MGSEKQPTEGTGGGILVMLCFEDPFVKNEEELELLGLRFS